MMLSILAAVAAAASPLPPARIRLNCPFAPIAFENGAREISAGGLSALANAFDWVLDRSRRDVRIVLTTATREPDAVALGDVSQARAEAVRVVLIADGVPADHIVVTHDHRDGPNLAPDGWVGGWVSLDFYVSPSVREQIRLSGKAIC